MERNDKGNIMDDTFMRMALMEARAAAQLSEVPVGAVIVKDGKALAHAHNLCESGKDATAHAELLCIQKTSKVLGSSKLNGCTLYVTLEPCAMCAGAAILSRLDRIVFGAFDELAGCCGSIADITDGWFNHSVEVIGGVLEDECAKLLSGFFKSIR